MKTKQLRIRVQVEKFFSFVAVTYGQLRVFRRATNYDEDLINSKISFSEEVISRNSMITSGCELMNWYVWFTDDDYKMWKILQIVHSNIFDLLKEKKAIKNCSCKCTCIHCRYFTSQHLVTFFSHICILVLVIEHVFLSL